MPAVCLPGRFAFMMLATILVMSSLLLPFLPPFPSVANAAERDGDHDAAVAEAMAERNEILVKFRRDVASAMRQQAAGAAGHAVVVESYWALGIDLLRIPEGESARQAAREYVRSGLAEYAEPNLVRAVSAPAPLTPSDPSFGRQWALHNNGSNSYDINAPEAWGISANCSSVVVAVIDTGIDYTHEDLKDSYAQGGYDFVNGDGDPMDDDGHGTHVAGIIAAQGDNGVGIAGVCWDARLVSLKAFDSSGFGYTSDIIKAIDYVVKLKRDHGVDVRVVNMSFGGRNYSQAEHDAIGALRDAGILTVVAAGNEGTDNDTSPFYPSGYDLDNIISVAAADPSGRLAGFSNYGVASVDIAAPGSGVLSTYPGSSYLSMSGTSMAAPHVTGAAALLAAMHPDMEYLDIKARLLLPDASAGNGQIGSGGSAARLLDLHAALKWSPASLTVRSVDLATGSAIDGMWVVVAAQAEGRARTAFTPAQFALDAGVSHTVTAHDYLGTVFDRWEDGSTDRTRSVSLTSSLSANATITAYYHRTDGSAEGFAPLTSSSDDGTPALTVNTSLADGTPLRMWTTIEPSIGAPGSYVVTVHNYGRYVFDRWADDDNNGDDTLAGASPGPRRIVTITEDAALTAYYRLVG